MPGATSDVVTHEVTEGRAQLRVPATGSAAERRGKTEAAGPGKREGGLFYNPAMRFARDLTVLAVEELAARRHQLLDTKGIASADRVPFRIYDGLAGTSVRAVRLALECTFADGAEIISNDRSAQAVALGRENVVRNDVQDRVHVQEADFHLGLQGQRADLIDIDPFGSPAPFLESGIRMVRDHGALAVTATDMTALCGIYRDVCKRRYDAEPWHATGMHEVALRILIGSAVRTAARHEIALTPLLSHATDHYIRVWLAARRGAERADAALKQIGFAIEAADGTRSLVPHLDAASTGGGTPTRGDATRVAGPLWIGNIHAPDFIDALHERLAAHPEVHERSIERFLTRARAECDAAPLCYSMKEWGRQLKVSPPPRARFFAALETMGHRAHGTHLAGDLFKTDAPASDIEAALRSLQAGGRT